jgi:hypothetical protein
MDNVNVRTPDVVFVQGRETTEMTTPSTLASASTATTNNTTIDLSAAAGTDAEEDEPVDNTKRPKKNINHLVRDQYMILEGDYNKGKYLCKHCTHKKFIWTCWNATKASHHIQSCTECPSEIKDQVEATGQKSMKKKRDLRDISTAEDGSITGESLSHLNQTRTTNRSANMKRPGVSNGQPRRP